MLGTLDQLAAKVAGRVVGDGSVKIFRVAAVDEAGDDALTFATDGRYLASALASKAAAVLADASLIGEPVYSKPILVVDSARHALVTLLKSFQPPRPRGPFRHPSAVVEADAVVADDAYIGAHAYVGSKASIGSGSIVDVGAYVGTGSHIGKDCWLHAHAAVMENCEVGDRVMLHSGSVVGSEGFGWAFVGDHLERIPQIGNVVLADDVEVGANSCVDRAQTGSTSIGKGTKIDNLVQIGHNCRLGEHNAIASLSGLAGSTNFGNFIRVAGMGGFAGHLTIGNGATIGAGAQVWSDVADGKTVSGVPARDHRERLRTEVILRNLPKLLARVEALERERK